MLDPVQLETFVTVARTLSFTRAAQELGLQQSTVSQHIRKLEAGLARRLFVRDTHSVRLTADGEALVGFAGTILETGRQATAYFAGSHLRGRLRFGVSEDLVITRLPDILRDFRHRHLGVELELTVGLSGTLHERLALGELDLVFGKRRLGAAHGRLVMRDQLVWVGSAATRIEPDAPVPLILYPEPSVTRAQALEVLQWHGRQWRITCTASSLSGVRAAVLAGLGVAAQARSLIPAGLVETHTTHLLPELGEIEFVLSTPSRKQPEPVAALIEAILANTDRLRLLG
jgi:DNA-binding transcriptional LysR family regulator